MALVRGQASAAASTTKDLFSLTKEALGLRASSDAAATMPAPVAFPKGAKHEARRLKAPSVKAAVPASSRELGPRVLRRPPPPGVVGDKNTLAYHKEKLSWRGLLEGSIPKARNMINAAECSALALANDPSGLRTVEAEELRAFAEAASAADLLSERRGGGLDDSEWRKLLVIIAKATADFPPSSACGSCAARSSSWSRRTKCWRLLWPWPSLDAVRKFGVLAPTWSALPAEEKFRLDAMTD